MGEFDDSFEKVKRAKKHINDLIALLEQFASSHLYSVSVEERTWEHGWLRNDIVITIVDDNPFRIEAALVIGDILHNLRSAMDLLFHQVVVLCDGVPTKWTRFPVRDTRLELENTVNRAVEEKRITSVVGTFILDSIKPYKAGNFPIWALEEMNIRDKHKLLIPTFKVVCISGIYLRNNDKIMKWDTIFTSQTCRKRLDEGLYGRTPQVEDKGKATTGIGFEIGVPFEGESVFPALNGIAEEVTRTIEAFQLLLGKN